MQGIQSMIEYMTELHLQPQMLIMIIFVASSIQAKNMFLIVKREVRASLVMDIHGSLTPEYVANE